MNLTKFFNFRLGSNAKYTFKSKLNFISAFKDFISRSWHKTLVGLA